jgi:Ca-activated chloride channel family protein
VEHLWARRKVGYLLDQIRANGEKKELVTEVVSLAKRYGITTPYTSYLIVPDAPVPVARGGGRGRVPNVAFRPETPAALAPAPGGAAVPLADFARRVQDKPGELATRRGAMADEELRKADPRSGDGKALDDAKQKKEAFDRARELLLRRDKDAVQSGKLGVDLSVQMQNLRHQTRLEQTAQRQVNGRSCMELGGVWIDEGFDAKMPTVTVQAQSDAYFRILERQPRMKDVFRLGNYVLWVTPNGTALVIDMRQGKEKLTDAEIDKLFVARK